MLSLFNLSKQVVTFRLRGWFMLGVLLPAFARLGQDLLSPCDECMCAQTKPLFLYSCPSLGEMESEPMSTSRAKSPLPRAQRRIEPSTLLNAGQRAQQTTD